ncbi:hypothetical protein [Oligella urethralis]|uniref:hypothetical protein n=1 Tax=Oligella urethralis TaxID=90245 RepID=UPI0027B9AA8D|nr:hypothetical protein [Oligella urethralis]
MKQRLLFIAIAITALLLVFKDTPHYHALFNKNKAAEKERQALAFDDHYPEAQCRVALPLSYESDEEAARKDYYFYTQYIHLKPQPFNLDSYTTSEGAVVESYGFHEPCPLVFNQFLLVDLYPEEVRVDYLERSKGLETQSAFTVDEESVCVIQVALPLVYVDMTSLVQAHLEQRLSSFEGIRDQSLSEEQLTQIMSLGFSSSCDEVMSDYGICQASCPIFHAAKLTV